MRLTESGHVVAVGSRQIETATQFATELGLANAHGTYESLVADPDVEAIYVATPHPMHYANARLALEAGKAVLVEKPFTMNGEEAQDLVSVARRTGQFLMEAMWTRFLPHTVEIRRLVSEGALGEIVAVEADHGQWFPKDPEHRLFAPELGGGALLDLGVYTVSFASMLLGTPQRIVSLIQPAFTGVDAETSMIFGYARGAQAILTCTSSAVTPTRASITGTEARIEVDPKFYAPTSFTLVRRDGERERHEPPYHGHGLRHEAEEVARCVRGGLKESPLLPLDESIAIMETMDAVLAGGR